MDRIAVAKLLKGLRIEAGFSQHQLAQRLRHNHTWVSKVERGVAGVEVEVIALWAGACGRELKLVLSTPLGISVEHAASSEDALVTALREVLPGLDDRGRALIEAPVRYLEMSGLGR